MDGRTYSDSRTENTQELIEVRNEKYLLLHSRAESTQEFIKMGDEKCLLLHSRCKKMEEFITCVMSSSITAYGMLMRCISSRIKLFLSSKWACEQALRTRIHEEARFYSSPPPFPLNLHLKKNFSPLNDISISSTIRIRRFGLFWFIHPNLVENID